MKKQAFTRRGFLADVGTGAMGLALAGCAGTASAPRLKGPNIIYILADDLGYGELGCYGQNKIKTRNIDRLAATGVKLTQHYSGSAVCAPSRCTLLTGLHAGHAHIRDNGLFPGVPEGQAPLPADTVTIAKLLQTGGYATACIGKWGLGYPGSTGDPNRQGFDLFFGYNCQTHAHNYYPRYLWKNNKKVNLPGNNRGVTGKHYAPDLMRQEALDFIGENRDRPFFLYYATPVPHVSLQVPDDSLGEYADAFGEKPFKGSRSYCGHATPRAAYAAMITRLDRDVGKIMQALDEKGLADDTLVIFSSDNGPTYAGGVDHKFFRSAGHLRGLKGRLYEGGIRVPLVARWPGRIKAGTSCSFPCANWDLLPTFAAVAGLTVPSGRDGVSILPSLTGQGKQVERDHMYWELRGQQAVRLGDWKGYRRKKGKTIQLFNLANDPGEKKNLAGTNPDLVERIKSIMQARKPSWKGRWNFPSLP